MYCLSFRVKTNKFTFSIIEICLDIRIVTHHQRGMLKFILTHLDQILLLM